MRFDFKDLNSELLLEKRFRLHENGYDYTLPKDVVVTLHYSLGGQLESVSWEKKELMEYETNDK